MKKPAIPCLKFIFANANCLPLARGEGAGRSQETEIMFSKLLFDNSKNDKGPG